MTVNLKQDLERELTAGIRAEGAPTLADLQLAEAHWITAEHDEFVKLIQRYRYLYATALFTIFGWVVGRVLGSPTLEELRTRADIAALLSILPLINVLFALVMLEAHSHAADLARYRFVLGTELYGNEPPWRWNLWRDKQRTSMLRHPTIFLNSFSALLFILLTLGAFWFSYPALRSSRLLWVLWGSALAIFIAFLITVVIVALSWLKGSSVVTRPPARGERWQDLWVKDKKTTKFINRELEREVASTPPSSISTPEERVRLWKEFLADHSVGGPPLSDYAVSRESIYTREDGML